MNTKRISIAITGAGASGTILAGQIIDKAGRSSGIGVDVLLIEKGKDLGPGPAYSTPLPSHILNMRADTLGASKNNPHDFSEWLQKQGNTQLCGLRPDEYNSNYPPRIIYGEYLKHILARTIKKADSGPHSINHIRGEAVDIDYNGSCFYIKMADESTIKADKVVVTPGNFPGSAFSELTGSTGYIPYPWPLSAITDNIPPDSPVCILGAGLSAIDTLFTLLDNKHQGKITFISRRGFLPKVQGAPFEYQPKYINRENILELISKNAGNALHFDTIKALFFREMENAEGREIDWLKVFNPHETVPRILEKDISRARAGAIPYQAALTSVALINCYTWNSLSLESKKLFDRKYKTLWTVYMHPMPLINAEKILKALNSRQLDIQAGCMGARACGSKGFEIDIDTRFGVPFTIKTPHIINATGQGLDVTKFNNRLLNNLLHKKYIEPHPAGGIYVDFMSSEVTAGTGKGVPGLFALGEITRGVHFFTNGIVPNMYISDRIAEHIFQSSGLTAKKAGRLGS